jgi:uncharacterized protein YjbI with pentapeptide repeats
VDWAGCDLSDGNLSDGDLSGADLSGATMIFTDVSGAELGNANLSGANLTQAAASRANLADANLTNATLNGTTLTGADLSGTQLAGADLRYVTSGMVTGTPAELPATWTLNDGYLIGPLADLLGADLAGQNLDGDNLSQAFLYNADLKGASVTGADLAETILVKANLTSADLSDADLASARLQNSTLAGTKLAGANLAGALTGGITGVPAVLPAGWQLLGGSFGYLIGPRAYLEASNLQGADLAGADLAGTDVRYAFMRGTNLNGADLADAELYGAYLNRATLVSADLSSADLTAADLTEANLKGAAVTGAVWTGVVWSDTICPNGVNSNKYVAGCFSALDRSPPVAHPSVNAYPTRAGWYTTRITVDWNWTDTDNIVPNECQTSTKITTSGAPVTAKARCVDQAGNTGHATDKLKVDLTRPLVKVTGVRNGARYKRGKVPRAGCRTTESVSGVAVRARLRISGRHKHGLGKFVATCSGAVSVAGTRQAFPVRVRYTVVK